jgi:hypothetical protein
MALLAVLSSAFMAAHQHDNTGLSQPYGTPTHDYRKSVTIQDSGPRGKRSRGLLDEVLDEPTVNLLTLTTASGSSWASTSTRPLYADAPDRHGHQRDPGQPANYIVDTEDQTHELKIPSGVQSGLKLVQGFDINENSTTELIFDFDVAASVVATGNSGKYILRPTIHQIDDSQTRTIIKGFVKTAEGAGITGAEVSLQISKPRVDGQDFKDEITRYGATVTDSTGAYQFWFLNIPDPLTFNAVATQWNSTDPYYAPDWGQIAGAVNGNVYPVDFTLPVPAEIGTLDLKAVVADADTDKVPADTLFVSLSFRQLTDLAGTPMVEVKRQDIVGYDDEWPLLEITAVKVDLLVRTHGRRLRRPTSLADHHDHRGRSERPDSRSGA